MSVVAALLNTGSLARIEMLPPGGHFCLTGYVVIYCLLVPGINLRVATLIWLAIGIASALTLPIAQAFAQDNLSSAVTILSLRLPSVLFYALSAPMIAGLLAYGAVRLFR